MASGTGSGEGDSGSESRGPLSGSGFARANGRAVDVRGAIEISQALLRGGQAFSRNRTQNPLRGQDETVALVEEVIVAKVGRRQVDGDKVGSRPQPPPIAG